MADAEVRFNRDIRPIMSDTCFRCHGPDKSSRMANMRLDLREEALKPTKSGVTPIRPGDPDHSAIVQRVFASTPAKLMPPLFAHKELSSKQKDLIRRWVAEGAAYEGHWAWQPINRTSPLSSIDAFVHARLSAEGLKPSPEADRRTLLRRVTLDLTGVPPTPEEFAAFSADSAPGAYERVVDRLLTSPRYAEQRTVHWLDAVRYADTTGFHGDQPQPAWPYRDYILRSFLENKPYDQFTREQIAGDLIPNATLEQKVASAYNRLNRTSSEGGLQPKEYLAKYAADRVRTTSSIWLGATMGCAECHDHKFDPITSKDFYSMKAFFADIRETGNVPTNTAAAFGTKLRLPTPDQAKRLQELDDAVAEAKRQLDLQARAANRTEWEQSTLSAHRAGKLAWHYQRPVSASTEHGAKLTIFNEELVDFNFYVISSGASLTSERKPGAGLIVASGPNSDNETYTITFKPGAGEWTALGIDVFQDESLPGTRLSRGADRFVLTSVEAESGGGKLPFVLATGDGFGQPADHPPMALLHRNPRTGWSITTGEGRNPFLALRFAEPVHTTADSVMTVRLHHDSDLRRATIGRFRLALSSARHSWPESGSAAAKSRGKTDGSATLTVAPDRGLPPLVLRALEESPEKRTEAQTDLLVRHFAWTSAELQPLVIRLATLEAERGILTGQIPEVVTTVSTEPRETRILPRANWMDDTHELVTPAIPAFLGNLNLGRVATRLDLANWLVSSENPLTARVFVNRLWREFFGTGLTKVLDDFGSQGEWPTHPELLDFLAADFAKDWDIRRAIRQIVTSQTYRQSSLSNPALDERDPENRLLARQSRFRLEAEAVRDVALSIAGLLVEKFGGPSVNPYQPDGYYSAMNFPKREYSASRGEDLYRRGLYTTWQRTFLHPSLLAFDAPTREECTINRPVSNTPLQALVLLNDPIYVEAARVFAQHILDHGPAWKLQLDWAFQKALNRTPSESERAILTNLYRTSRARFVAAPAEAAKLVHVGEAPLPKTKQTADLAAMTTIARAILNLHETITRN